MRLLLTVTSCLLVLSLNAQMIGLSYEIDTVFTEPTDDFSVDLEGYVVYDVFAEFTNSSDQLIAIYSDIEALGPTAMFIDAPCGCFNPELGDVMLGGNQNENLFDPFPEMEFDTYWTLDFTSGEDLFIPDLNYSSATMCSVHITNGAVFAVPDIAPYAGGDLKIQIAQVTTCDSFLLSACFNVFVASGSSSVQEIQDYCVDVNSPFEVFADLEGCTDESACSYDPLAVYDDGTCIPNTLGCMDETACNYLSSAICDSGMCIESGCTDEMACNYNENAGCSDSSCLFAGPLGCGPGTIWDEGLLRCVPEPTICGEGTFWDDTTASCLSEDSCQADLDGNGVVAIGDLLAFLIDYGTACN